MLLPINPAKLELEEAVCFDCPAENTAPYLEHYAAFDPYVRRDPSLLALNQTARLSDVVSAPELDHSEFSDFMTRVPYRHALAAVTGFNGQANAAFSLHRRRDEADFRSEEMAMVERIAPHLGRALGMRQWLANPEQRDDAALLALAGNGELRFMNQTAQR